MGWVQCPFRPRVLRPASSPIVRALLHACALAAPSLMLGVSNSRNKTAPRLMHPTRRVGGRFLMVRILVLRLVFPIPKTHKYSGEGHRISSIS